MVATAAFDLETCKFDTTNAFTNAEPDEEVYVLFQRTSVNIDTVCFYSEPCTVYSRHHAFGARNSHKPFAQ
jgi:hypothetical protein